MPSFPRQALTSAETRLEVRFTASHCFEDRDLTFFPPPGLIFSDAFNGNSTTNGTAGGQQYQQVIQMSLVFCPARWMASHETNAGRASPVSTGITLWAPTSSA